MSRRFAGTPGWEGAGFPGGAACVMVVDDHPSNIRVVGSVLGEHGMEVIPATDGETALKRIAHRRPDLILLDLRMPVMDGCEVCLRLRQDPELAEIPVIFLSAEDDKEEVVRALESGGVDYITKPFNQAELISRVRTQLALKWARDRAKQLAEDRDELIGILTHDLKNHLGGIQMSAQLLNERASFLGDERCGQLAGNIERSTSQLLDFLGEFLANAAAEHGLRVELAEVSLREVVSGVVHQFGEAAARKGIRLGLEVEGELIPVRADEAALRQVVENLVSNALKFSHRGSGVRVRLYGSGPLMCCSVVDEGPGFTDEDKGRMFRRYVRLSARPTAGEPSTGLGLSIVRRLVGAMGGELECESEPGRGTTFTVRLPAGGTTIGD